MAALDLFSEPTRAWFQGAFHEPTPAQERGWAAIAGGRHTLIHAPTGSGKTLAAFLWALDRLFKLPVPPERDRCRVLYVSPMKALAYDIERNLRAPLAGIANAAAGMGLDLASPSVAMRTGDTPSDERRRMLRHPPDILITTPESLYLMLTSSVKEILTTVRWVVVDEIHSVAGSKRGAHLALSLERLEHIAATPPQRIGLSATQRPLETIAGYLAGGVPDGDGWDPRPVDIVDVPGDTPLEIDIVVPLDDMTRPDLDDEPQPGAPAVPRRSIWPALYPEVLERVMAHRSTIVFANSRGLVERMAKELNALAGEEIARAHHGSVSREQRVEIEDALKRGLLRCVVATSSLELGIDMEAVDLVILVESPNTVSSGLQRVGRAGHQVGAPSVATVFPKHRGDLLEAALVVERMRRREVEVTTIPQSPLDVLAQQIVACVSQEDWEVDALYDLVRRAAPFARMGRAPFEAVLDMLAGRYPSDDFAELRPRVVWDRIEGLLTPRSNARILAVTNPGTIPDRGLYTVVLPEGGRVGELDEEMVYESRVGDTFVLGSSTWQITDITLDRVVVAPAPGAAAARLPFWHGDALGRPLEVGRALGAFIREIGTLDEVAATTALETRYRLDSRAAANLVRYLAEEREATGALPTDRTVVIETFRDEIGDWRLVLLTPFGGRVHAPWAMAASHRIREHQGVEVDAIWSDDGFILRFPDADRIPDAAEALVDPDDVELLVLGEIGESALFAARFREAAARALLLPRRKPGQRMPLWLQRRRASSLLEAARRFPSFPIVLEAYREVLQEYFDIPALREVLAEIQARRIRPIIVDLSGPSPFANSLMFDFVASFMYDTDAPSAERRAMALTIDRALLRDLLGEPELRDLLDAGIIAEVEAALQHLTDDRKAGTPDDIVDLLRDIGPLSTSEVADRHTRPDAVEQALAALRAARRIVPVTIAGKRRWAAVEDMSRLRDALGVPAPPGVAAAHLAPVADPLGDVVARFARTHGPFLAVDAARSLALPSAAVEVVLTQLEARGRVSRGAFRPGGTGREWVDAEVLRRLRRRSLAAARREVEAVEPAAFGRFLPEWHGIGGHGSGDRRAIDVIRRLQGATVPASILESDVLDARMDYTPAVLDAAAASGEVVWMGRGPLGARDGKVALYLRDQVARLAWPLEVPTPPTGPRHDAIRAHLADRGASFFRDLYAAAGGGDPEEALEALWDLVWAGEVTNDTLAPLRAFLKRGSRRSGSRRHGPTTATPPSGNGRWYLVTELVSPGASDTESAHARAEQLLERSGIVTRDGVASEGVPGGFAGLYRVLAAMEEAGRARRGYFVEGLGGSQFALPGAIDRLRGAGDTDAVVLAAADPANPYGAALPWPDHASGRPSRSAGAHVVLVGGNLTVFVERGGRRLLTFGSPGEESAAAVARLATKRRLVVATIDGEAADGMPLGRSLVGHGFTESYKGLELRVRG